MLSFHKILYLIVFFETLPSAVPQRLKTIKNKHIMISLGRTNTSMSFGCHTGHNIT